MADNPPAFPLMEQGPHCNEGMSLRDWFAGQALAGYIAHLGAQNFHAGNYTEECAQEAYAIADAMLAARKAGQS